jgi:outer membrane receptor protein involved in Fe transport
MKADRKRPCIQELSRSIAQVLGDRVAVSGRAGKTKRPSTILSASGGALLGAALVVAPYRAMAQEAEEGLTTETVIVTGSRIPRRDFTANSPITTIDEAVFDETTSIGVETILNQLPQFVPAVTQFTTFDVENTATNTVGASTVSLRGLGPNRNLVLVNGKRAMPINPTMVVDTNSIPASAIERVEVISGGASAVYGADAVGGVVNFILKEDFEGASVDVRFGDTQHGGNQEVAISGLIGANLAGGRGNVLVGVERSSRSKQMLWERDWRVADYANPATGQTQVFPTETWFSNPWGGPFAFVGNLPDQGVVNGIFDQATPCGPQNPVLPPGFPGTCPQDANGNQLGVSNASQIYINRTPDGTGSVFAGLNQPTAREGAYRYEGPYDVDNYGQFAGLPFRVIQPDGAIKENTWYQPASIPLDRLSAFGRGVFDVSDTVSINAQAMFTRTENTTSLGATSDTIGLWGAAVPFGNGLYGPSVTNLGPDGLPNTADAGEDMTTLSAYTDGGIYGLDCPAVGGCAKSEAWPVPQEVFDLMISRPFPEEDIWVNRTQDDLRYQLGDARGSNNHTNTMQLSLGIEGELPSGNDFWDVTVSTGRTDTQNILTGSIRLTSYRQLLASPNYGTNFAGDPNPAVVGFAEGSPTCTSGIPIVRDFHMSEDCIEMLYAPLQNQTSMKQDIIEANLIGDLLEMRAGPMGYALGATYREASFDFTPDNLIRQGSTADSIAGTFPTVVSRGAFDVAEIYGELLIPIVSGGPAGVEHFSVELGGRISDWSVTQVDKVETYKALIDWGITPRYRLRGGYNRAMRAPNLGELFVGRSQVFQSLPTVYGDQCSQNHETGPFSANGPDDDGLGGEPSPHGNQAQADQTEAICRELMGSGGAFEYYDNRPLNQQPTLGGLGTQNTFGNPDVYEEQADTLTLGVVMDFHDNWTLTVDYYEIEIKDMIAIQSPDSTFESCVSLELNPSGATNNINCEALVRNPANGGATNIDLTFTNQGRAKVAGVDLQLDWTRMFASGGFNMNMVANYNIKSETQDRPELDVIDWAGTRGCALQIECQGYDYRTFTTLSYFRGPWNVTLRHQFWPSILDGTYAIEGGVVDPLGSIDTSYQLVYLGASYSFSDRYTLRFGIENLFDEEPPLSGGDPDNSRFPVPQQHVISLGRGGFGAGGSSTYEPLGRRGFVSMTMDF